MTTAVDILPADVEDALLLGRVFDPEVDGPCLVTLDSGQLVDVTSAGPTMTQLLETPDLLTRVDAAKRSGRRWALEEVVAASEVEKPLTVFARTLVR